MAAIPIQPVTVTIADLTAIKTALSDKADQLDRQAAAHRHSGPLYAQVRKELRDGARQRDALAARLSFAVAGEPIQVIEGPLRAAAGPARRAAAPGEPESSTGIHHQETT